MRDRKQKIKETNVEHICCTDLITNEITIAIIDYGYQSRGKKNP